MKAKPSWMVAAMVRREVACLIVHSVLAPSVICSLRVSCFTIECNSCSSCKWILSLRTWVFCAVHSCVCNFTPAGLEFRGWYWADCPYHLPLYCLKQTLNWKEAGIRTHWNGSVPVWLYWLGTKLSGSVYRCNPQHWASRPCCRAWNYTDSGVVSVHASSKHFTCWDISPHTCLLNFN